MRENLKRWLELPYQVWHWREDEEDADHYRGVETANDGFRWFAWSHLHGEDGPSDIVIQTFADFRERGPARPAPSEIVEALGAWLNTHRPK